MDKVKLIVSAYILFIVLGMAAVFFFNMDFLVTPKYVGKAVESMEETNIRSGVFVLYGEKYSYPMVLSDFLEKDWSIVNTAYKKGQTLNPGESYENFMLYRDEDRDAKLQLTLVNTTGDPVRFEECLVSELSMEVKENRVVLPGGIYYQSKNDEFSDLYGKAEDHKYKSSVKTFYYEYQNEDGWDCKIELNYHASDSKVKVAKVTYSLTGDENNKNLLNQKSANENSFHTYASVLMELYFEDRTNQYVEQNFGSGQDGEKLRDCMMEMILADVMTVYNVDASCISEECKKDWCNMISEALGQAEYEIKVVDLGEDRQKGSFELGYKPTDFAEIFTKEVKPIAFNQYMEMYGEVDLTNCSEYDYKRIMEFYAKALIKELKASVVYFNQLEYRVETFPIDYQNGILSSKTYRTMAMHLLGYTDFEVK